MSFLVFLKSLFTWLLDRDSLGVHECAAVYLGSMRNETAVIHGRHFSEEAEGEAACRRVLPCPLTKKTLLG